jgi:hypothetical protein
MQAALRPMSLGEILDRTFAIYRKNFWLFAGIAAVPAVAMLAIHLANIAWVHPERWLPTKRHDQGTRIIRSWFLAYGFYHISGFLGVLAQPAFVWAASRDLFGKSNSILGSLRFVIARWRTYLWIAFLKMSAQLFLPETLAFGLLIGCIYLSIKLGVFKEPAAIAFIMLFIFAVVFAVFFLIGIALAFAIPAAALEETSGWKALRRSWKLTQGSRGRILVAWIMATACAVALEGVVAFLAWWIATLIYTGRHYAGFNRQVYEVVVYSFYAVIAAVVGPLYPIAITLLYYDQRSRKEGFDVEIMMEAAGLGTGEPGTIRNLSWGETESEGAGDSGWSRFVKFIRGLRGFD